ncbi:MAG: hypothetical protein HY905_02065 [Deltaproteobacteria bacterium]|nr:hypothetical protein [Deltaproteobacteria bacterium]
MRHGKAGAWWAVVVLLAAGCGDDDNATDVGGEDGGMDVEEAEGAADADADGDLDVEEVEEADAEAEAEADGGGVCEQEFWIWDLSVMPPRDTQICCSLHGEGEHEHVWVEDEQWGPTVDSSGVDEILRRWDVETPDGSVDPTKGIFEILTGIFGDPPDAFDGDAKIYILLYGMEPFGSSEFDGYFRSDDQTTTAHSNRHEMIHINSMTSRAVASPYMIGVMAHEFHHMLQWRYDPTEEAWLSESMAETAMLLTGYLTDVPAANSWARNPTNPLIASGASDPVDYGAAFLFGAYLIDRLSPAGLRQMVEDPAHGMVAVGSAAGSLEAGLTGVGFLAEFATALLIDDETASADGRYAFLALDPPTPATTTIAFPAAASPVTVPGGGVKFANLPLDGAAHAQIGIDVDAPAGASLGVRVVLVDPVAGNQVQEVIPGTHTWVIEVPDTATALQFALATDEELPVSVAITAADE